MFWNRFFYLCERYTIKPLNVVKALNIGAGSITNWKNGTIPNGETLSKIADYFNVSIDYLLGRDDSLGTLEIRRRVKEIAEVYNLPIKVIENTLGTNYATFQAWCNGYGDFFDNIATFSKISQLFDVPIDYLLGCEVPAQHENLSSENTELKERKNNMFWNIFENLCNNKNIKPTVLVKQLTHSSSNVTVWKNKTPNIDNLLKIADYFNVPIDYLLDRDVPAQHENLSSENMELINKYTALTPEAQQKVNAYIDDLMNNPKYAQNALARYKAAMKNKGQIAAFGGDGVQSVDTPNVSPEHIKDLIKETKKTNNS